MISRSWLLFVLAVLPGLCNSQELVKDINQEPQSSYGAGCVPCGGKVFFVANERSKGFELWRTDGTEAGTVIVKDLAPGTANGVSSSTPLLTCLNDVLYFTATSGGLWRSDGTEAGTIRLVSTTPTSQPLMLGNKLAFVSDPGTVASIYTTSPDVAGNAVLIKSFGATGSPAGVDWIPFNNKLFLIVTTRTANNASPVGTELWLIDETSAELVKAFPTTASFSDPTITSNGIVFLVNKHTSIEVWKSDGTAMGTVKIADLDLGSDPSLSASIISTSFDLNEKAYISALDLNSPSHFSTWVTDGTPNGTKKIYNDYTTTIKKFNDKLYFNADYYLYSSNLDYSNIHTVSPFGFVTMPEIEFGDKLFFGFTTAASSTKLEPYFLDQNENYHLLKHITGANFFGPNSQQVAKLGNQLIFFADDGVHGVELWKTDGTSDGTNLVKDIAAGTEQPSITILSYTDNKLYFQASSTTSGTPSNIWVTNGTEQGTTILSNAARTSNFLIPTKDYFITLSSGKFNKVNTQNGNVSSLFDPTVDYTGISAVSPARHRSVGEGVYFYMNGYLKSGSSVGSELWYANPMTNEMKFVKDISAGSQSSYVSNSPMAPLGNKIVFAANEGGLNKPWVSDGTAAGTFRLKDINPGKSSASRAFITLGSKVLFSAKDDINGEELYVTDGTTDGTIRLTDTPGNLPGVWYIDGTGASNITRLNDKVYFCGAGPNDDLELWVSDGTLEGTVLLKDLEPNESSGPGYFFTAGGKVYFTAYDLTHGYELWVSDGTPEGTNIIEMTPGPSSSSVSRFFVVNDVLYFGFNQQLYVTQGTRRTTKFVANINPTGLFPAGDYLCFLQDSPEYGTELFRIPLPDLSPLPKFDQTISFSSIADKTATDSPFSVVASTTSYLPLKFSSSSPDVADVSTDGKITIKKSGEVTITITQEGDDTYNAATPVTRTFTIMKVAQTITFNELPVKTLGDASFTLTATTSSGLPVVFSSSSNTVQLVGATVNLISAGKATITVSETGNDVYTAATPVSQTFCINPAKPTINQTGIGEQITLTSTSTTNVWKRNDVTLSFTGKTFTVTEAGVYKAAGTAEGCQGEFSDGVNVVITGLEDLNNNGIEVFPNPVEKNLTIRCQPQSHIRIVDVTGKEQINEVTRASESVIDVSSFAAGVYVIAIRYDSQTHYSKFLKR